MAAKLVSKSQKQNDVYNKVLVGTVTSFTRGGPGQGLTSTGIFNAWYTGDHYQFKLHESQLYSDEEALLLNSMIVKKGQGARGVVLVLDEKGYVSIVRDSL